ncbi:hypothetical protein PBI_CAMILLE_71 [Microbacterium phage Camille]|nr:hypothetical protein PBI_CAMILLE_71 [Microbacterium phage Camille]
MRPLTKWEKFKKRFIWGQWSWKTFLIMRDRIVIGKLKVMFFD